MTVKHKLQTLQLPPDAFAQGMRWRRPGVRIPVLFHIDLLTNEAMFTGWNPTGTEASLPINIRLLVQQEYN